MVEQASGAYQGPFWRSNGAIFIVLKAVTEAIWCLTRCFERGALSMGSSSYITVSIHPTLMKQSRMKRWKSLVIFVNVFGSWKVN